MHLIRLFERAGSGRIVAENAEMPESTPWKDSYVGTLAATARIVAVQLIREVNARELKDQRIAYFPNASIEPTGLGMHIMDSRVGAEFPASVRDNLSDLLYEWK